MKTEEEIQNEADTNSEKTKVEAKVEVASKKITPPASDKVDDEDLSSSYRPSSETGKKVTVDGETVPLKKYLDVKAKLKELREASTTPELTKKTLDDFAEEAGLKQETVANLVKVITAQAKADAVKAADEKVAPIILEKQSRSSLDAFDQDFEKRIASKYPELAKYKDNFKKVAFSKDFLHLKSLDDIKNEFYPDYQPAEKEVNKEVIEGGSKGGNKETTVIDFSTLKDHEDQYERVMKDDSLRKKYYAWQDTQV